MNSLVLAVLCRLAVPVSCTVCGCTPCQHCAPTSFCWMLLNWRRKSESNRRPRLCRPLHNHSAIPPFETKTGKAFAFPVLQTGAGNESRTRDLNLGKVALYQLSYSRFKEPPF